MACQTREKTGTCSHHQCQFSDQTREGYECVDVIDNFCEIGLNCVKECPYSYEQDEETKVTQIFKVHYE